MVRSAEEIIEDTLRGHVATPEEISIVISTLTEDEVKWRDRGEMLKQHGYVLRPRLRPGWKPSWFESGEDPLQCEDGELLPVGIPPKTSYSC
jgi:hypothetical protein